MILSEEKLAQFREEPDSILWNKIYLHNFLDTIADLKRQLAERDAAIMLLGTLYDKWEYGVACYEDPDEQSGYLGNAFQLSEDEENRIIAILNAPTTALDAYVQERVDRAVLAESEAWSQPLDPNDPVDHATHAGFYPWCEACITRRLSANRAKVKP